MSWFRLIGKIQPAEVYNLAAQSHVRVGFDAPEYTTDITATGTVRLLEAIRGVGIQPRFYQASSSEMFGLVEEVPAPARCASAPRTRCSIGSGPGVLPDAGGGCDRGPRHPAASSPA